MTAIDLTAWAASLSGSLPLEAYLADPTGTAHVPGVVMVHEAFGLDDVMRRQAERIAAAGLYLTLAVDLYSAGGTRRCLGLDDAGDDQRRGSGIRGTSRPVDSGCWNRPNAAEGSRSSVSVAWVAASPSCWPDAASTLLNPDSKWPP